MKFEELKNRKDLMIDLESLKKEAEIYFNEVSKDELKKDLEELGCIVEEVDSLEFESYVSELKLYYANSESCYKNSNIDHNKKEFESDERDLRELDAA